MSPYQSGLVINLLAHTSELCFVTVRILLLRLCCLEPGLVDERLQKSLHLFLRLLYVQVYLAAEDEPFLDLLHDLK